MSLENRRRAFDRGRRGEALAALFLRLKGYRILARSYRVPVGEIDIVAWKGGMVVAVEVKARDSLAAASEAIILRQRRRIERALTHFLKYRPEFGEAALRFDAMLIVPGKFPKHIKDAWRT